MIKSIYIFIFFTLAVTAITAQSLKKTERINDDQVPVMIKTAFEKDFGKIPDDGYWTANFIVEKEGKRSAAKPLSYTFHKKSKTDKIEVRYTADGKLDFSKGLEKNPDSNT